VVVDHVGAGGHLREHGQRREREPGRRDLEVEARLAGEVAFDDHGVTLGLTAQRQDLGLDAEWRRGVGNVADDRLRATETVGGIALVEV
jgi:hypothetical protein